MVAVNMEQRSVSMRVNVEVSRVPAVEQSQREKDNERSDQHLRPPLNQLGQQTAEEHHRHAEQEQRGGVSQAPRQTEQSGSSHSALPLVQQQGGHRGQMIWIESVTQAEYHRNNQGDIHRDIIPYTRSKITDMARSRRIDSRP